MSPTKESTVRRYAVAVVLVATVAMMLTVIKQDSAPPPAQAQTPGAAPLQHWQKNGCSHGHTRRQSKRGVRSIYRSSRSFNRARGRRVRHFIRCVGSAKTERDMRRYARRWSAWRKRLPTGNRRIAYMILLDRGQTRQWPCLNALWWKESKWDTEADNPKSSAYGIAQALPGTKYPPAGRPGAPKGTRKARAQIVWGLGYIAGRYGTPCGAWSAFRSKGWY